MNSKFLMKEYNVDIDDIRWYLSVQKTEEILSHYQEPKILIKMIWDKSLEDSLYNMEERYLTDLDSSLKSGTADEVKVRQVFGEIKASARRRRRMHTINPERP